jgi:hypothetical protein
MYYFRKLGSRRKRSYTFNLKIVGTLVDAFPSSMIEKEEKRVLH